MQSTDQDVEAAIAAYRTELEAEAELARGDLEEIEDHLRSLIDELRESQPLGSAIAEARMRLGDPRRVAREHSRVRTPFGARLSRARSWGAGALIVTGMLQAGPTVGHFGVASPFGLQLVVWTLVVVALFARVAWARPIVIGTLAAGLVWHAALLMGTSGYPMGNELDTVRCAVALGLVMPWRRRELTSAGSGLALLALPSAAAMDSLAFFSRWPDGVLRATPFAAIAFAAVLVAMAGFVLRARWGALPALIASVALIGAASTLSQIAILPEGGMEWQHVIVGLHVIGSVAAAASAVLCWRSARSHATPQPDAS